MSRVGKKTINIPAGVNVDLSDREIKVKGPKGELTRVINPLVKIAMDGGVISVSVGNENEKRERALWGTFSSHIQNMVEGVTNGFSKQLEVNGVGYRVSMQGTDIKLEVGYSHPVIYKMPSQVIASVEKNVITLTSPDVEKLGRVAAEVRSVRKPEPYKGKGIKYMEETIRRKAGKAAKAGA